MNHNSSLQAVHLPAQGGSTGTGLGGFNFDTSELQHALTRSQQQNGSLGGLRRATSAPHSMNLLGLEDSAFQQQRQQQRPSSYLPPSGGPMRRVASSIGMRRSSSFFWTPAAHFDFERAINALAARGAEVNAATIMQEMSGAHMLSGELKITDVDKHLRKKALVQRRVLQHLSDRPTLAPTSGACRTGPSPSGMRMGGLRVPGAIAEEPSPRPGEAAEQAAAISDDLAQQLQQQRVQHMQLAAARQAMVGSVGALDGTTPSLS